MKNICILGATGSIGQQALALVDAFRSRFRVSVVTAKQNDVALFAICQQFAPDVAVVTDSTAAERCRARCLKAGLPTIVLQGEPAMLDALRDPGVDVVINGIVGFAGVAPAMAAVNANKRLLLANKEVLVSAGRLFSEAMSQSSASVFPLDSEHHALYECFNGEMPLASATLDEIDEVILTASGGALRNMPLHALNAITPAQAVNHPTWPMGAKISVDSATLVNKAFEIIEAHFLFNLPYNKLSVLLHPQSSAHALVRYRDGSLQMQLASPDMRLPISRGLAWPGRLPLALPPLDTHSLNALAFSNVDAYRYPAFECIVSAVQANPDVGVIINAANEVAVTAFLAGTLPFTAITPLIKHVLTTVKPISLTDCQAVVAADNNARMVANACLEAIRTEAKETV